MKNYKKLVGGLALASVFLLVSCENYSKVDASKAKEIAEKNLKKEVSYTKGSTTMHLKKFDFKLDAAIKDTLGAGALGEEVMKQTIIDGIFGEEGHKVGDKVSKDMTAEAILSFRLPAEMFVEQEGTTYYAAGSKLKIVKSGDVKDLADPSAGLSISGDVKVEILINEYNFMAAENITANCEITGMATMTIVYSMTNSYSK